jgi:hypothetical protein
MKERQKQFNGKTIPLMQKTQIKQKVFKDIIKEKNS